MYCKSVIIELRGRIMQAIEFETVVENGFIRVPDIYKSILNEKITVIITSPKNTEIDYQELYPPLIDTTTWKFDREEANER
jgi:hypothetical protein